MRDILGIHTSSHEVKAVLSAKSASMNPCCQLTALLSHCVQASAWGTASKTDLGQVLWQIIRHRAPTSLGQGCCDATSSCCWEGQYSSFKARRMRMSYKISISSQHIPSVLCLHTSNLVQPLHKPRGAEKGFQWPHSLKLRVTKQLGLAECCARATLPMLYLPSTPAAKFQMDLAAAGIWHLITDVS